MLTLTSPFETRLHRWPAGAKLLALCLWTVALFWLTSPVALGLALAGVAMVYAVLGAAILRRGVALLRPLWPFALIVMGWHIWTGAMAEGLAITLRMAAAVAGANLVTMTTRLSDMQAVLTRVLAPISPILPPARLALAFALVIRFVPVLAERVDQLSTAFRARSPRKRAGWRIIAPAALAALDEADRAAEALRARGGVE